MAQITEPIFLDKTGKGIKDAIERVASAISGSSVAFGFHISDNESDPDAKVQYRGAAIGLTPARNIYNGTTGEGTFDYGDWEDAFFMPKPCMVKYDGTVDYYLNPNDYTQKIDGTASDIADSNYAGNAMMEWPKVWMKIVPENTHSATFWFAPSQLDEDYHDYPYIDSEGMHKEHFYTAIYNSSVVNDGTNDIARSLSGAYLMYNKTADAERTAIQLNNQSSKNIWDMQNYGEYMLITGLAILMGKSTDTQAVFGRGLDTGGEAAMKTYVTGTLNNKGLFYGTNTGTTACKIFGMENWYACQWRRMLGLLLVNGTAKTKLCYGPSDGSTQNDYDFVGANYVQDAVLASDSNGQVNKCLFSERGFVPYHTNEPAASSSTYYCDYHWVNLGITAVARVGGVSGDGLYCGAFCFNLSDTASLARWSLAAAMSCR